jgi:hypothetical protein
VIKEGILNRVNRILSFIPIILAATLLVSAANANVIYNASFQYEDGYTYSFTMEFVDDVGVKTVTDLVGLDFSNETFTSPEGVWSLHEDRAVEILLFDPSDPSAILFESSDWFLDPILTVYETREQTHRYITTNTSSRQYVVTSPMVSCVYGCTSIPEPATLSLLGIGLAVLGIRIQKT